ncbi:hypothetical protein [Nostoc sp.]|uniref:hypothetical protein n=1 Tax=Nostoc sp. TaxID=1180 RepID=UPI002FFAD6B9
MHLNRTLLTRLCSVAQINWLSSDDPNLSASAVVITSIPALRKPLAKDFLPASSSK